MVLSTKAQCTPLGGITSSQSASMLKTHALNHSYLQMLLSYLNLPRSSPNVASGGIRGGVLKLQHAYARAAELVGNKASARHIRKARARVHHIHTMSHAWNAVADLLDLLSGVDLTVKIIMCLNFGLI
jgi:hypothetical protein